MIIIRLITFTTYGSHTRSDAIDAGEERDIPDSELDSLDDIPLLSREFLP